MVHVGAIQPVPQWWTGTVPDNQSTAGAAIWKPGFKQRQLHLILTANLRKLGYFEGNLLLTHYIARSILWAIPWNQIKQCFIVVYLLHLHKPNWSQAFHLLPFPEYIASLPGFLLHWWQSRVTALHFPQDMWSFVKTTQLCFQSHCCRILGGFFVSTDYLPHLVSRELPVFA